jgi:hypothetical protein
MNSFNFIRRYQRITVFSLRSEQPIEDHLPRLNREGPWHMLNLLSARVKANLAVAAFDRSVARIVANVLQPLPKFDERREMVVAGIHEPLEALILLHHRACPTAKATVGCPASGGLILTQNNGTLATLGVPIKLNKVAVRPTPGGLASTKHFPYIVDSQMYNRPVDEGTRQLRMGCQIGINQILEFVDRIASAFTLVKSHA